MLAALVVSAAALAVAPAVMPSDYSWLEHTTSESAAQGVPGAWLARFGFLSFGLTVLGLAAGNRHRWGSWGRGLHALFGALMAAAAAFSARSWRADQWFDPTEDLLHSVAATGMGFAFAFGIVAVALNDRHRSAGARIGDLAGVAASVLLPLAMTVLPEADGTLQRVMFAIAYCWYAREALDRRDPATPAVHAPDPGTTGSAR